jgi:AcrR family transcriptional regulator
VALSQPAESPRRLPREERERQILDVAHKLFAERGYAAVTMDDVAARVGVTKPLLYNYWGNKERLYLACLERDAERLLATVRDSVAADPRPEAALETGVRAFFAFIAEDRGKFRVVFDETVPAGGDVAAGIADYRQRITDTIAALLLAEMPEHARAKVRDDVEGLSHALLGAAEALGRWWVRGNTKIDAQQTAELLITTVLPGLKARSNPSLEGAGV